MPWTIDDHRASAQEALDRGIISGRIEHLAAVPEPLQSTQHQARVSSISILNEVAGPHAVITVPWSATPPPVEPPVGPGQPPAGAIVIPTGVHSGYTVDASDGDVYWGEPGAILDGNGDTQHAFAGTASGVQVLSLEIRNYSNPYQSGAVHLEGGNDNRVVDCDIHHNNGIGVRLVGDGATILDSHVHHQHQLGVSIDGADGEVSSCDISFNNWLQDVEWGWEAGGSKFWETTNLLLKGNYVHNNHGPGLWADHGNRATTYEDNIVEDNFSSGIFHEISYDCTIRRNQVRRNGHGWPAWLWGAGIQIANAGPAIIHDNILEDNKNGICFTEQGRGYGPLSGSVYANTLVNSGITGTASDQAYDPEGPFGFERNSYIGGEFAHGGSLISFEEWLTYFPGDAS